jgi:hypothetical protein
VKTKKCVKNVVKKESEGKRLLWRPTIRWKDGFKMGLKVAG